MNKTDKDNLERDLFDCIKFDDHISYPFLISYYFSAALEIDKYDECFEIKENILRKLNDRMTKSRKVIGYQSSLGDFYFQNSTKRLYNKENIYFSKSGWKDRFSYNIQITKNSNDSFLDGSYISYNGEKHTFTAGKLNYWWSSSDSFALSVSNSARPFPSVSMESINPIVFERISFLGPISYKFFLGKLEKDREIPNTKFLGARVTFYPSKKFTWSLSRTAQFGGDGRPQGLEALFNLIIGRDNAGKQDNENRQPGNQIASLNMTFRPSKQIRTYFNISGEDEAGYLPSRTFYNFGMSYAFENKSDLGFDFVDTQSSDRENYVYSHFIYLDGWRYLNKPIGAAIDADSESASIRYNKNISPNKKIQIKYLQSQINKNNNEKNFWSNEEFKINSLMLDITFGIKEDVFGRLLYQINDKNLFGDKKFFVFNIEYYF
tara:strand:- start:3138 stop:4439 length:1302 start_codon:yes stop_codon:yes gene_type:complete